jgi:hypothetical protein
VVSVTVIVSVDVSSLTIVIGRLTGLLPSELNKIKGGESTIVRALPEVKTSSKTPLPAVGSIVTNLAESALCAAADA